MREKRDPMAARDPGYVTRGSQNWEHGESKGLGWGGPPSGSVWRMNDVYQPGNQAARLTATMTSELRAQRKAERQERAHQLENILFDIAQNSQRDDTRVAAATRLHAILEGLPVARVLTADAGGPLEIAPTADPAAAADAYLKLIGGG